MFSCDDEQRKVRIEENYTNKVVIPLSQRDDKGRKGILVQVKKMNLETINYTDLFTLSFEVAAYLLEEEETLFHFLNIKI